MKCKQIKYKNMVNAIIFVLILLLALKILSWLFVCSENSKDILENHSGHAVFLEKDNSVDVVALGNSNFHNGIDPSYIWEDYGIPMYVWGEPSHRIYEIEHDLKKLFRHQSPKLVFLEASCLMRDETQISAVNQQVKADIASVFELVACHKNIKYFVPGKIGKWSLSERCRSKGYYLSAKTQAYTGGEWMDATDESATIPSAAQRCLERCIKLCRENGAQVVLMSIPSPYEWSMAYHNAVSLLAEDMGVELLDLNMHMEDMGLDWEKDTGDGGYHMNYRGAEKISKYVGRYLEQSKCLPNHKGETEYAQWNQDCIEYAKARNEAIDNAAFQ